MQDDILVESGSWTWGEEGVNWEVHASSVIPDIDLCTAAFCVVIENVNKVVMVKENRGWGLPGGHIEDNESLEDALRRECMEEAGVTVKSPTLFAYRKIIATNPITHPSPGKAYPFPISYIAYYWYVNDKPLQLHTEPEVLAIDAFRLDEIRNLNSSDLSTIELGFKCHTETFS